MSDKPQRPQPNGGASRQGNPTQTGADARRQRVEVAAYYNAERRGFRAGGEMDDWLQAEGQIDGTPRAGGSEQTGAVPRPQDSQDAAARPDFPDLRRSALEHIDPDQIRHWAEELRVAPARLREAIRRVGPALDDVRRFLET